MVAAAISRGKHRKAGIWPYVMMIDESPRVSVNGRLSLYMETGEDQTSVSSDSSDVLLIPSRVKNGVSDQMNSSYNRNNTDFDTYGGLSMRGAESTSNGAKIQCREKPVECMGINHIKANQVAFAKAEIETGFYSEGTGKIVQEVGIYTYLLRIIPQNIDKEAGDFIYFEMKKTAVLALHPPLMMMDIERKNDMNVLCLVQPKP
ncbi:hypothetical protein F2Q70_00022039 [Brassica cretica]|uniref:Uncharacterized protein n=1 Tax=Brassica cretica TaxID=69181 RepID=A0A8S9GLR5_BRACR|nr:hypothetical protein F2Q70_00022039 [Brassica cretica]KAF2559184.1 hypothetical protein F2Q68_00015833 [Brassica cretica]